MLPYDSLKMNHIISMIGASKTKTVAMVFTRRKISQGCDTTLDDTPFLFREICKTS